MQILVISDIHANETALKAVLQAADEVDEIWFLGDLVGYGPDPNQCVETLKKLPNFTPIIGNHDAAVVGRIDAGSFNPEARQSLHWTRNQLADQNMEYLESLPEIQVIDQVTLVHGSPREPIWEYVMDRHTAFVNFEHFETDFCFVGHSHLPGLFHKNQSEYDIEIIKAYDNQPLELKPRTIINPGSVGQPRDQDPRAAYALFDPKSNYWEFKRIPYAIEEVQARMRAQNLPERHILRLTSGW
jgi:predicted phosphodiesterase